ncbi:MAG: hypothetical protein IPQ06_12075 [Chitinophagaceae bacterium]|nr:hypothetical protein [Chitinophagaceae bacterium]
MNTIEIRLQKLEASNRRYKRIVLLMMASFATFFMAFRGPKTAPDVLQAKRFEVVDDNGHVLVRLNQSEGNGTIKTYRTDGKKLLNLTYSTKNEGYIGVEDGKDQEMMRFTSSNDGGGGYIGIFNPYGKRTMTLCNDLSGGNVYLGNSNGDTRAALQCNSSAGGFLGLYNSSGYTAVKLTQTSSGNGDLYVNNNSGDERVRLSVSSSAGNLQLKNNGKVMIVELGGTAGENGTINTYNTSGTFIQGIGSRY